MKEFEEYYEDVINEIDSSALKAAKKKFDKTPKKKDDKKKEHKKVQPDAVGRAGTAYILVPHDLHVLLGGRLPCASRGDDVRLHSQLSDPYGQQ